MGRTRRAIVLSDIHLGPGGPLATFRDADALAGFFLRLADEPSAPGTELVLAGDCFDFLQSAGYDGFDATKAADRFEAILRSPLVKRVLEGLRRFAARPGAEVTLLSGNHDPELLCDDVRGQFEEAIDRRGTVLHADDEPLRHAEGERPPVWGRALGDGSVWVVHGDRWDPLNMIHRGDVRAAALARRPVELPAGSRFVFEIMNHIKPGHGWVDELKPEMPSVLLLLLYLAPELVERFLRTHYGVVGRLFIGKVQAIVGASPLFGPDDQATMDDMPSVLAGLVAEALSAQPEAARPALLAQLGARLRGEPEPVPGSLATHGGLGKLLLRAWLARVRASDRFQEMNQPDEISRAVAPFLPPHLAALVAGHTHGPRAWELSRPAYFNSGTWIPVSRIPDGPLEDRIDELEKRPAWASEAPRTFVRIGFGGAKAKISLGACDRDGTPREVTRA